MLVAWVERWVPDQFCDPLSADFVRARLLLAMTAGWIALCCWAFFFQLLRGAPAFAGVALGTALLAGSAPLLLRRTGSLAIAGNILTLAPFLGLTAANLASGGQAVASVIILAFVPLVAALVTGRLSACAWTAGVCLELLGLPWLESLGLPIWIQPSPEAAQTAIFRAPMLGALFLLSGVLAYEAVSERGLRLSQLYNRLQRSEQRNRQFVETAPDGICTTRNGVAIYANPALLKLLGVGDADAVRGRPLTDFVHPDDHQSMELLATAGAGDAALPGFEIRLLSASRKECAVEVRMSENLDAGVQERLYVLRDLTRRKRLERQVRQSQKMDAIGQLAGGVAHDFNNLLTVILGAAGSLLADPEVADDEERRQDLEAIREAAERSGALTSQLLAFGRRQLLQPRLLDLNDVVQSIDEMVRRLVPATIRIETCLQPSLPLTKADASQLERVILNVVLNARDAGAQRIQLTTESISPQNREDSSSVQLTISDDGCGMDAKTREKAFDPFFTTKRMESGTGLGLSTVHGIVMQSGGEIDLESVPDEGTTLRVRLPAYVGTRRQARSADSERRAGGGDETILLVEDEPQVRRLAAKVLNSAGYHVIEACDGQEALGIAARHSGEIDLLVSDLVMPNVGGAELAERLLQKNPTLPVLFISGHAGDSPLRADGEPHHLLRKPFAIDQLIQETRRVLDAAAG